jgi:hypothetical protein
VAIADTIYEMGFDIKIQYCVDICPYTGQAYIYGKDKNNIILKEYDLKLPIVPEKYWSYIEMRGKIFYAYTQIFNEQNIYTTSTEDLLEAFPSWDYVKESEWYVDYDKSAWNEENHNLLKECLVWFSSQSISSSVSWSY